MSKQIPEGVTKVKLWDPLLRSFHWLLVICVGAAWYLGQFGPNVMTLHFFFGYAVIGLLAFRVVWGLVGPAPARFAHFVYRPRTVLQYLSKMGKREPSYWPGHNPAGALAAFVLLLALVVQVGSGLFVDPDDYINVGPLAGMIDREGNRLATQIHNFTAVLILAMVVLHIGAIAFYKVYKRENLAAAMVTGWKWVRKDTE